MSGEFSLPKKPFAIPILPLIITRMKIFPKQELEVRLRRINGRGYKAYKEIQASYDFGLYLLHFDHIQGDPFASPSRVCVEISREKAGFSGSLDYNPARRLALEDYLARKFAQAIQKIKRIRSGSMGSGKSGLIEIDAGGQEVLKRTALVITDERIEARFFVGLPAFGRTITSKSAEQIFSQEIPEIVKRSLLFKNLDSKELERHLEVVEDWYLIQSQLKEKNLVAFVARGSILPRRSGVDDRPLTGAEVIKFESPDSLKVEMELSRGKVISGMGIPAGITLIVGGGFHGKSTLLEAISKGVYPHIPGDGREYVASLAGTVKIRAEDGRRIEKVDISAFISGLPFGKDTRKFSTDNASGSTSQSANIIEALEMEAEVLLLDEDTSATNFMIRDQRMQRLVAKEKEPITPFIDRVREIYDKFGVSTILVMGGSGDYFDVADTVIQMDEYRPRDVSQKAKEIASQLPSQRLKETPEPFSLPAPRQPQRASFDASRGKREVKISAKGLKQILYGKTVIDLSALEQLVSTSQTRAVAELIYLYSQKYLERYSSLPRGIDALFQDLEKFGLDYAVPYRTGDLAMPRKFELAGAINRMRTLKIK